MQRVERVADVRGDAQEQRAVQRAAPLDQPAQIATGQVFHDQKQGVCVLAQGIGLHDVGVVKAGRQPRLADEPLARAFFHEGLRIELLDGDRAQQGGVFGPVDDAEAAAADLLYDLVFAEPVARFQPQEVAVKECHEAVLCLFELRRRAEWSARARGG